MRQDIFSYETGKISYETGKISYQTGKIVLFPVSWEKGYRKLCYNF